MRITGGLYKGRRISAPKGQDVRPTTDMVRQAVFNILQKYDLPGSAHVVDLCCGTGALGLEALSRGADFCVFVDQSRESLSFCRQNAAALEIGGQALFLQRDARKIGKMPAGIEKAADLLFLDPPYRRGLVLPALQALAAQGWLAPAALCVLECEKNWQEALPPDFVLLEQRPYGDCQIILTRYHPAL